MYLPSLLDLEILPYITCLLVKNPKILLKTQNCLQYVTKLSESAVFKKSTFIECHHIVFSSKTLDLVLCSTFMKFQWKSSLSSYWLSLGQLNNFSRETRSRISLCHTAGVVAQLRWLQSHIWHWYFCMKLLRDQILCWFASKFNYFISNKHEQHVLKSGVYKQKLCRLLQH